MHSALLVKPAALREQRGDLGTALGTLRQVVDRDLAHEQAHVHVMRLLVRTGQRHLGLRQCWYLRDALRRELDAEPETRSGRSSGASWRARVSIYAALT